MRALSPTGAEITGTLEVVKGTCGVMAWSRDADGSLSFDYDGTGTEVDWDSQKTVTREGKRVFVDENGQEWTEDQIELVEDDDGEDEEDGQATDE
jgi:hypothetical protein